MDPDYNALSVLPYYKLDAPKASPLRNVDETQAVALQADANIRVFEVADTTINVAAGLAALKADSKLDGLSFTDSKPVLSLTGVGTLALSNWLAEARAGARARPIEATLNRGPQGYSGNLVVSLGGGS